jgi:alpha-1,3-glucan synthase
VDFVPICVRCHRAKPCSTFRSYTLADSLSSFNNDGKAPFQGCLSSVTMEPYSFKIIVPVSEWAPPRPAPTKFSSGHARIPSDPGGINNSHNFFRVLYCHELYRCHKCSDAQYGHGCNPTFDLNSVTCRQAKNPDPPKLSGDMPSAWFWSVTLQNVPDGILALTIDHALVNDTPATTGVRITMSS